MAGKQDDETILKRQMVVLKGITTEGKNRREVIENNQAHYNYDTPRGGYL